MYYSIQQPTNTPQVTYPYQAKPRKTYSQFIPIACAICGVLCISLPIPIIVNNFNKFYEKAKIEEEILAKKKKSSWDDLGRKGSIVVHFSKT